MNEYWQDRGFPWEYDPGPPKNRSWARIFAETPNYRGLGKAVMGHEKFRWHFGPMFYRGRLRDNRVKVMIIGQEGAQDESLAHRSFTGGTGARMQNFLNYIGIPYSYLFLNTFVYPIFGQYTGDRIRWLAQDHRSPITIHRHKILDYVIARNDVQLVIAVGNAAKESVVTWVESRGGSCPAGAQDVSRCSSDGLGPRTRFIGVVHPGGAGQGGSLTAITADFTRAANQIKDWTNSDPGWLPPDPDGEKRFDGPFQYRRAPIPFRDFPFGTIWRLGRGGTSSNRRDGQRSIQVFGQGGKYNNQGDPLAYSDLALGNLEGYAAAPDDVPYEPPKDQYREYDKGPGHEFGRLLMGGVPGHEWPDFGSMGAEADLSFGTGPIFRGRHSNASILIIADQQSHDDLFTGRALTGEVGQHLQAFLEAIGVKRAYAILRVLPIDTLSHSSNQVRSMVDDPQVRKVYRAIVAGIIEKSDDLSLVLTIGPHAARLASHLDLSPLPQVKLKSWRASGSLSDWQSGINAIRQINYQREIENPAFSYNGERGQIPRIDLPYGVPRWMGTSGDRARQAMLQSTGEPSPHYFRISLPDWVYESEPSALSPQEQDSLSHAP